MLYNLRLSAYVSLFFSLACLPLFFPPAFASSPALGVACGVRPLPFAPGLLPAEALFESTFGGCIILIPPLAGAVGFEVVPALLPVTAPGAETLGPELEAALAPVPGTPALCP